MQYRLRVLVVSRWHDYLREVLKHRLFHCRIPPLFLAQSRPTPNVMSIPTGHCRSLLRNVRNLISCLCDSFHYFVTKDEFQLQNDNPHFPSLSPAHETSQHARLVSKRGLVSG